MTKYEPQTLIKQLCCIILPLLLERLFPLMHVTNSISFYYMIKIFFLTILGVTSNTSMD